MSIPGGYFFLLCHLIPRLAILMVIIVLETTIRKISVDKNQNQLPIFFSQAFFRLSADLFTLIWVSQINIRLSICSLRWFTRIARTLASFVSFHTRNSSPILYYSRIQRNSFNVVYIQVLIRWSSSQMCICVDQRYYSFFKLSGFLGSQPIPSVRTE